MAGFEADVWLQLVGGAAASVVYNDDCGISVEALDAIAAVLPTLPASSHRTDLAAAYLADQKVPYSTAEKLFDDLSPASAKETIAFLCRPDLSTVDAVHALTSERRMTVLVAVAELTGRDPAIYEAVVAAFGKAAQKAPVTSGSVFDCLLALLTNPDVPVLSKATAAAAPSAYAWSKRASRAHDTPARSCWEVLESSGQLQAAAFDGLSLPDSMLLDCALWQGLSTAQLRVVFACLQRCQTAQPGGYTPLYDDSRAPVYDYVSQNRISDGLLAICDHVAATDKFLSEIDDWLDEGQCTASTYSESFFWCMHAKHRRQKHPHGDPTMFWSTHPKGPLAEMTLIEWSHWTRLESVPALVDVLAEQTGDFETHWMSWLASPLTPLFASASSTDLLAGLEAAAATGLPDVLTAVEELCWVSASYDALTFDVLRRLRQTQFASMSAEASARLLELLAATLGSHPALWQVFDKVSVEDATIGEILELAAQIIKPDSP